MSQTVNVNDGSRSANTPGKTRQLIAACAGTIVLLVSLSAQAAFVITGGSASGWPVGGNDFTSDLNSLGYNQMLTGGQLSVDMDGKVTFHYIAAESGYSNSFTGASSMSENNESFNWDGWNSFSIDVSSGDVLDFNFNSASSSALSPVDNYNGSNLQGLGIMSSTTTPDLVLAYNDNYLGYIDSDFDDMLVRASFSVVPIPAAAWLFGSGLLGLIGLARRRKP